MLAKKAVRIGGVDGTGSVEEVESDEEEEGDEDEGADEDEDTSLPLFVLIKFCAATLCAGSDCRTVGGRLEVEGIIPSAFKSR